MTKTANKPSYNIKPVYVSKLESKFDKILDKQSESYFSSRRDLASYLGVKPDFKSNDTWN